MYVETIFSETLDGAEYLYWYSIQGHGGTEVRDSAHWLDEKHLEYWDECIDPEFAPQTLDLLAEGIVVTLQFVQTLDERVDGLRRQGQREQERTKGAKNHEITWPLWPPASRSMDWRTEAGE